MSNIFKTFQNCINGLDSSSEEIKEIPTFVFCKYLGSNYKTIQIANFLNYYYKLPNEIQYKFVQKTLNGKLKFIKFIKPENLKISDDEEILMKHFKINKKVASEYLKEIDPTELNRLRLLYKRKEL